MTKAAYHNPQNNLHSSAQHTTAENRIHYERHRPEETVLYQLVQEHIESFFAQVETETGSGLPDFVKDEFDAFLECGVLAHGFLRLRCSDCIQKSWSPFPVNGEDSVLRAVGGTWRRRRLTWSITSFPMCPCANEFSHCQFHCAIYSLPIRI